MVWAGQESTGKMWYSKAKCDAKAGRTMKVRQTKSMRFWGQGSDTWRTNSAILEIYFARLVFFKGMLVVRGSYVVLC